MDEGLDPAGAAVFLAVVCGIAAIACGRPGQWGLRRLALGASASSAGFAALVLSPSFWWWGAILWGVHQMYLGWSYISRRRRISHERVEYLESSGSVLAYVALADGAVDERERAIIRDTYARAGCSPRDLQVIDRAIEDCETKFLASGSDPNRLFVLLRDACFVLFHHSSERTRLGFLRTAILIAASDGFLNDGERRALWGSANWLGITRDDYDRLWGEIFNREDESAQGRDGDEPLARADLATHYASILGVVPTASPLELKRAYRDKAKQYHPDVVAHRGPIFAREAEERFKEVTRAYAYFRRNRVSQARPGT